MSCFSAVQAEIVGDAARALFGAESSASWEVGAASTTSASCLIRCHFDDRVWRFSCDLRDSASSACETSSRCPRLSLSINLPVFIDFPNLFHQVIKGSRLGWDHG